MFFLLKVISKIYLNNLVMVDLCLSIPNILVMLAQHWLNVGQHWPSMKPTLCQYQSNTDCDGGYTFTSDIYTNSRQILAMNSRQNGVKSRQ